MTKKIIIFLLIQSSFLFGNNKKDDFLTQIRNENYSLAKNSINKFNFENTNCNEKYELLTFIELSKNKGVKFKSNKNVTTYIQNNCSNDLFIRTISKLNFALYNYYYKKNSDVSVLSIYLEALNSLDKTNLNALKSEIIRRILEYHNNIFILKDYSYLKYVKLYKELAQDKVDEYISNFYKLSIGIKNSDLGLSKENYNITLKLIENLKIDSYNNRLLIIAGNYLEEFDDKKLAIRLYQKSLNQIKNDSSGINILSRLASKLNIGIYHFYNKEFEKAINQFNYIHSFEGKLVKRKKIYYDYWLSLTYEELTDFKSAYKYLKTSRRNQFSFNQSNHLKAVREIQVKYETEKKEKENLQLKIDKEKNRSYLIATLLALILISVIGILSFQSSKRKRKLAEQQKDLEKQKNLTLLKEQELTTINAMVEGQEKERKRVAKDLHDNLGSVLATLKLHFENLKMNREKKKIDQEILFNKTEGLIDEAYLKVRSIAHAKNAGVIANQGLLMAIKLMAEKISSADKIQIEVVDFGLNKRLDNSLEISVFRIIQELITNTIKHANAKNATINISLYDKNLNIIIEDDGIGFNIEKVNLKEGMGLSSIKTRIEHLSGNLEIDSTLGKGSSIIIDIPIS